MNVTADCSSRTETFTSTIWVTSSATGTAMASKSLFRMRMKYLPMARDWFGRKYCRHKTYFAG
jgi:hypothetical protein